MKRSYTSYAILMAVLALMFASCDLIFTPEVDDTDAVVGVVTGDATDIAWNGAKIPFAVTTGADAKTVEAGICIWQEGDWENRIRFVPEETVNYRPDRTTKASITFKYLKEKTTYKYCAWATMNGVEFEGETKTFNTKELVLEASKAVDMGLSVKWAGYNVGASAPEGLGGFFAWGETSEKEQYTPYNYGTTGRELNTIYNKDAATRLEAADDAATASWGEGFRMPTCKEKHELLLSTDRYYITYKDTPGILFESNINGNCIFFPYTGARVGNGLQGAGDMIGIWTSDLYAPEDADSQEAYIMCNIIANGGLLGTSGLEMDGKSASYNLHSFRYMGYSIRAVSK